MISSLGTLHQNGFGLDECLSSPATVRLSLSAARARRGLIETARLFDHQPRNRCIGPDRRSNLFVCRAGFVRQRFGQQVEHDAYAAARMKLAMRR